MYHLAYIAANAEMPTVFDDVDDETDVNAMISVAIKQ